MRRRTRFLCVWQPPADQRHGGRQGEGVDRRALRVGALLRAPQWRLFFLAFSASCAGNGLIVSTLGAILGAHATASDDGGGSAIALGAGVVVSTATLNGGLLASLVC